jgi:hypothetical protein
MTANKSASAAARDDGPQQNGQPEPVRYVYRDQRRRNTYAARLARRNTGEWPPPAAGAAPSPQPATTPPVPAA